MADATEPNDRDKLLDFARLVFRLREAQMRYFRRRSATDLAEAKNLERHVDDALADILGSKQGELWNKM